jgi:hypothetical protein
MRSLLVMVLSLVSASAAAGPDVVASSPLAGAKRGDSIVVPAGTRIYSSLFDQSSDDSIGTVARTRSWTVLEVDDGRMLLERRARGMIERIIVSDVTGGERAGPRGEAAFVAASVEDCRDRGRCNFALAAGQRLDALWSEHSLVRAKTRIRFARPVQACMLGRS